LRALAIASWFRENGFKGEIHYQGFGEDGQLVKTLDETAEPANRRAIYILAAEAPPTSEQLPRSAWRPL
jgi:outer membrane protein OmpA-like peptidoglycan-associated protein